MHDQSEQIWKPNKLVFQSKETNVRKQVSQIRVRVQMPD